MQVSDYFVFDSIQVNDLLSDGHVYDDSAPCKVTFVTAHSTNQSSYHTSDTSQMSVTVLSNAQTQIIVTLLPSSVTSGRAYGGLSYDGQTITDSGTGNGPTTFQVQFNATVDDRYRGSSTSSAIAWIDINDVVSNQVTLSANNYNFYSQNSYSHVVTDGSSSETVIGSLSFTKSIYAINGEIGACTSGCHVTAGTLIT